MSPRPADTGVRRARSRFLALGLGPLLVFVGLALVSGSFSIAGFAQGNSQGDWGDFDCREFHTWPQLPEDEEDFGEYLGKDVGDFQAALVPADPEEDQTFTVGVTGAYPSYGLICNIDFTVGVLNGPDVELGEPLIHSLAGLTCDEPTASGVDCDEMTVLLTAPEPGECVDAGTEHTATLIFHVEQPAKEATQYAFQVEIPAFDCIEESEDPNEPEDPGTQTQPQTPTDEVQGTQVQRDIEVKSLPSTGSGGFIARVASDFTIGMIVIALGAILVMKGMRSLSQGQDANSRQRRKFWL